LKRNRAIAQTKQTISYRVAIDGVLCDVVCTGRFYFFLEKRKGRWGIVLFQPILEKDRLDLLDPSATLKLDGELLARYPEGYRHLAYALVRAGQKVRTDMPGLDGPALDAVYARGAAWLAVSRCKWLREEISIHGSMSALGQKQTLQRILVMSALPPKADIGTQPRDVRFVPKADIMRCSNRLPHHMETCRAKVAAPRCVTRPANEEKSHGDKNRFLSVHCDRGWDHFYRRPLSLGAFIGGCGIRRTSRHRAAFARVSLR
jgi:hypothetical protein